MTDPAASTRIMVPVGDGVSLSVLRWDPPVAAGAAPVLLVHGLASNARLWDGVAAELARFGHLVAAVDQRGHGQSSKPGRGYDFGTLVADLAAVLEHLGWSSSGTIVAGQSWGGNVVLHLAAERPELVGALTLVDGGTIELQARFADWPTASAALAPPPLAGAKAADFERLLRSRHADWPESGTAGTLANVEVLADGTIRPWLSREDHMLILRELWADRPGDLYSRVKSPVLMIMAEDPSNQRWMAGKRDEVTRASDRLAVSDVRWVQGDHDLHAQFPSLVAELIHEWGAP